MELSVLEFWNTGPMRNEGTWHTAARAGVVLVNAGDLLEIA